MFGTTVTQGTRVTTVIHWIYDLFVVAHIVSAFGTVTQGTRVTTVIHWICNLFVVTHIISAVNSNAMIESAATGNPVWYSCIIILLFACIPQSIMPIGFFMKLVTH